MRTFATLAASLLIGIALSGCFGDDGDPAGTSETTGTDATSTGGPDPGSGPTANTPPIASFVVLENGTELAPQNGSLVAGAGVNLTFDASESTDAESAELTYAWDFGGAGTGDEVTSSFAFTEPGNYTVTLNVTDPEGASGTANATLVIASAEPAAPSFFFLDDADKPFKWTFKDTFYPDGEDTGQNHPVAAGWHVSTKDKVSGTKSYTFQDERAGGYHDNELTLMTSDPIDLTGVAKAFLSFNIKGDSEVGSGDDLYFEASKDAGATWVVLGSTDAIVGKWTVLSYDLAKVLGGKVQLRFRFTSDFLCSKDSPGTAPVCGAGTYQGYFLDDILIGPTKPATE